VNTRSFRWETVGVWLLVLAWVGIWGAWIPAKTASLTQNALYLAEWSTILPESRFGGLAYLAEVLRASVAVAVVALAVGVGAFKRPLLRWSIRLAACLPGLVILPPYPEILNLWRSVSYGSRFLIAAALFTGILLNILTDIFPRQLRRWLVSVLCLVSAGLGIWAFFSLQILFEVRYTQALPPGWGFGLFVGGLVVTGVTQIVDLIYWRTAGDQETAGN
jgi:hypothetical protein